MLHFSIMKIKFQKRRMRFRLIMGIVWLVLGACYLLLNNEDYWIGYLYFIPAILFLIQYIYDSKHQYLNIDEGYIQMNKLLEHNQRIQLDDIEKITGTDSYYIVTSKTKNLKIDPSLIDQNSLIKLIETLKQLDLPPEKNLFSKFKLST